MTRRVWLRLDDIQQALADIDRLLHGMTMEEAAQRREVIAAYERFLEIVSEASRHIPTSLKDDFAEVPWRRIADLGNVLRHAYHRIDLRILWEIYELDIPKLRPAIDQMKARSEPKDG